MKRGGISMACVFLAYYGMQTQYPVKPAAKINVSLLEQSTLM